MVRSRPVIAISVRCRRVSIQVPVPCWYSLFPEYTNLSLAVHVPSNRMQLRVMTIDCSSGRSRCSSESDDDDDGDDCCRTDGDNGGDIYLMAF